MFRRFGVMSAAAVGMSAGLWSGSAGAINITLDYSHDTFFAGNATAKAALEQAAADLSDVIITSLPAYAEDNSATVGGATVTINPELTYKHPTTGASQTYSPEVLAADEVKVFVGVRNIIGTPLGQGGPGGVGYSAGSSYNDPIFVGQEQDAIDEIGDATAAAATKVNNNVSRGGNGPVISSLSGSISGSVGSYSYNYPYQLNFGSTIGNLWFDVDTDNSGHTDSAAQLDNFWHFDHTTAVAQSKYDFYSVALHELLHAIGFGASDSWDDLVSGNDWLGPNANALLDGGGVDALSGDLSHVVANTESTTLFGGVAQEAAMDPDLTNGDRKYLTELDAAFLRDIGWDVVPEPGMGLLVLAGGSLLMLRRRGA